MSYPLNKVCVAVLLSLTLPAAVHDEPCRTQSYRGASYLVCSFDLTKDDLRTYWRRDDGKPYRTFAALADDLEGKGKSLRFAMNGGMYGSDFRPVGLYAVEAAIKAALGDCPTSEMRDNSGRRIIKLPE